MFSSLFAAKRSGVIAFAWTDEAVIVHGLDAYGKLYMHGVAYTGDLTNYPVLRTVVEQELAVELGIVRAQVETWTPEDFNS